MSKIAYFYTDKPENEMSEKEFSPLLKHLGADSAAFLSARYTQGFESGIDWEKLPPSNAVVLYDTNDAAVFGICLEIENSASLEVYEYFQGKLFRLRNLKIAGKEEVCVPVHHLRACATIIVAH